MSFKSVFIAVFVGTAAIVAALVINAKRPHVETSQPTGALVAATGKCAECHLHETSAVVHQYERSRHAQKGVNCLDCHRPAPGQESVEHKGFTIALKMTAKNCQGCHVTEYEQFARSRHGGAAWTAVMGKEGMSDEQIAAVEKYHPGTALRDANPLVSLEGNGAVAKGCGNCHAVGKPNPDGSFGSCTECHSRHSASVALAREPTTCGQCHMGPDHSQLEIYEESKHGVLFAAERSSFHLDAEPKKLTTVDMPVPTCATCHMSGLEGAKVTHDVSSRLSWYLFAAVSEKRPSYVAGQDEMKEVCEKCHASSSVNAYYSAAEVVVRATNEKVKKANDLMAALAQEGLLTKAPFDQEIDFIAFDLWHYYGRTAKHGAFMGGADFVQWHGNYELLHQNVLLEKAAAELRARAHAANAADAGAPAHD